MSDEEEQDIDSDEDMEDEECMEESDDERDSDGKDDENYLIDNLRTIEGRGASLDQLLLRPRRGGRGGAPGDDDDVKKRSEDNHVSSLQVQSLVAIVNSDSSKNPKKREPKPILGETVAYLIQTLQAIYRQQQDENSIADAMGLGALYRALSIRI